MSIQEHLNKIRNAVYGHEVRESIAKGIETAYDDASENGNANMEVKVARGTHPNLRSRLENTDKQTASQLAQKVDKGNVSVSDINKNLGKLDQTFMTDDFLQQMVGNTPINAVPADGSLTTEKFANNSVNLDKISDKEVAEHQRTINLFDKNDAGIESGGYYNGSEWVESSSHAVSGLIPVELNQGYTFLYKDNPNPFRVRLYFYNENGEYVTGGTNQSDKLISSSHPYIRFSFLLGSIGSIMMIKDADIPNADLRVPYIPYLIPRYKLKGEWGIGNDNVLDGSLDGEKLDDVEKITINSINLFDKTDPNIQVGGYYNAGVWTVSNGNTTSGFIPIERGVGYTFFHDNPPTQVGSRINFYDEDFNYLRGGSNFSSKLTGSSDATYVRVTTERWMIDSFMMIKDTDIPDDLQYIPFSETKFRFGDKWDVLNSNNLKTVVVDSHNSDLYSPNYTEPVKLDLKDFSGYNQPWHPSAQYIEAGLAGAKYWLAQSPYPNGGLPSRVRWEVPVVYKSNDGVNWTIVANPLDDLTQVEIDRGDYMSDPEIVWREDLGRLEVWYRHSVGTGTLPTTIFRKTTTDGITWTAREVMMTEKVASDPLFMRSPSITFEDGKYKAWFTNDSRNLFARPLMYSESTDGKAWSQPINCTVDIYRTPWHTSVKKIDETYHYLCYYRPIAWADFAGIGETLFYYTSTDGLNYKFERTILSTTDNNSSTFYKNGLYRSDVIKGHDGKMKLYFCFVDDQGKNAIGYMSADNLRVMNAVPKVDARNAVTRNGESLDDLQMKLDRLRIDFDNL